MRNHKQISKVLALLLSGAALSLGATACGGATNSAIGSTIGASVKPGQIAPPANQTGSNLSSYPNEVTAMLGQYSASVTSSDSGSSVTEDMDFTISKTGTGGSLSAYLNVWTAGASAAAYLNFVQQQAGAGSDILLTFSTNQLILSDIYDMNMQILLTLYFKNGTTFDPTQSTISFGDCAFSSSCSDQAPPGVYVTPTLVKRS